MAHEDTEIELGEGVTVLTGPNNVGKSAVVEAIRSVAQNPPPHHVVRHGASQAVVRLELDSGEAVEWVRSGSSTIYRLYRPSGDGEAEDKAEVYAKFGRTPPEDIRNLLRLDPVETESGPVDIHIGNQRYPIFLLDQTGSQAASFFAASTEAEYLLKMQQALKIRTDRSRSKRKELTEECTLLEKTLSAYKPLDTLEQDLIKLEALHTRLLVNQKDLPKLEEMLSLLVEMTSQLHRKENSCRILAQLIQPPEPHETKRLDGILEDLERDLRQLDTAIKKGESLELLSSPPSLEETVPLKSIIHWLENCMRSLDRRSCEADTLAVLESPPLLHKIKELQDLTQDIYAAKQQWLKKKATEDALDPLAKPPEIKSTGALKTIVDQWASCLEFHALHSNREKILGEIEVPPTLHDLKSLQDLIFHCHELQMRLGDVNGSADVLKNLMPPPDLLPVAPGDEILDNISRLGDELNRYAETMEELDKSLSATRQEIERLIEEIGMCPLCGQPFDLGYFLEERGGE